jgi:D-3-phosphoglycerate dehydrogenase / 2-oxoglutarate reductase
MNKFRVIVTDDRFDNYAPEKEVLEQVGAEVVVVDCKSQEEVIAAVKDADGVLLKLHQIGKDEIAAMEKCKVISSYGVGFNNIDVDAATAKGIWVSRVPEYDADEVVSDQAMALMMDCVRRAICKYNKIIQGRYNLMKRSKIHQVKGSTVGIIGLGNIGKVFCRKVSGFEPAEILVYDPYLVAKDIADCGARKVELYELLEKSDIISMHCPETNETKKMIDAVALKKMKNSAILINCACGGVVDENALAAALEEGEINAAGLDVFVKDPLPMDSPLRMLNNVVIDDHDGFYTEESLSSLKKRVAENIAEVFQGRKPVYPLNCINKFFEGETDES